MAHRHILRALDELGLDPKKSYSKMDEKGKFIVEKNELLPIAIADPVSAVINWEIMKETPEEEIVSEHLAEILSKEIDKEILNKITQTGLEEPIMLKPVETSEAPITLEVIEAPHRQIALKELTDSPLEQIDESPVLPITPAIETLEFIEEPVKEIPKTLELVDQLEDTDISKKRRGRLPNNKKSS